LREADICIFKVSV